MFFKESILVGLNQICNIFWIQFLWFEIKFTVALNQIRGVFCIIFLVSFKS